MHCSFACSLIRSGYTLVPVHPYTLIEYGLFFSNIFIWFSGVGKLIPLQSSSSEFSLISLFKRSGWTSLGNTAEVTAHLKHSLSFWFFTLIIAFFAASFAGKVKYEDPLRGFNGSTLMSKDTTLSNRHPEPLFWNWDIFSSNIAIIVSYRSARLVSSIILSTCVWK